MCCLEQFNGDDNGDDNDDSDDNDNRIVLNSR